MKKLLVKLVVVFSVLLFWAVIADVMVVKFMDAKITKIGELIPALEEYYAVLKVEKLLFTSSYLDLANEKKVGVAEDLIMADAQLAIARNYIAETNRHYNNLSNLLQEAKNSKIRIPFVYPYKFHKEYSLLRESVWFASYDLRMVDTYMKSAEKKLGYAH